MSIDQSCDGMIGIVYNVNYGGFGLSDDAVKELHLKSKYDCIARHDQRLVKLMLQHGSEWVSTSLSKLDIEWIDKKYTNFYCIDEYDGMESVNIEYDCFKVSMIQKIILNDAISSDLKVEQIKKYAFMKDVI